MYKKIILSIFLVLGFIPILVNASVGSLVKVGNKYYDSLAEAIANASENDVISLISDVKLDDSIEINKKVNINLNGNDITAPEKVFLVEGGELNLTGKGTIKETNPNYGAIMVKGSTDPNDEEYSVVNVDKDITLEGWSGIFITHNNSKSYGAKVNFGGKINAVNDTSGGTGIGIYVNGNIKDPENSPVVNILDGAKITSTGNGLYFAGYGEYNINEADISGSESGIGIKSGILNIDGATVTGTGPDATPTPGYNDGIKASGTAIQIESNDGYAGEIELNIDDGRFISNNSNVIYEYIGKGNHSQVIALDISGGTFESKKGKDVIRITDSLKQFHSNFISGGQYSSNPEEYLKSGYAAGLSNGKYEVIQSTILGVFSPEGNSNNAFGIIIITLISIISLGLLVYFNKTKILNIIRN
ncbi:MAG: hypothetical protein IJE89_04380 [Bacilli bacterium]|nr:hypothetical protein [Bacilli bacterium]